jgi:hypothetical protein
MQPQVRYPPAEAAAILARSPRVIEACLGNLGEGDRFTIHVRPCLVGRVGICTCRPLVSEPMPRVC